MRTFLTIILMTVTSIVAVTAQIVPPATVLSLPMSDVTLHATGTVGNLGIVNEGTVEIDLLGQPTPAYCSSVLGQSATIRIDFNAFGADNKYRHGGQGADFTATVRGTLEAEVTGATLPNVWVSLGEFVLSIDESTPQAVFILDQNGTTIERMPWVDVANGAQLPLYPRYVRLRVTLNDATATAGPGYEINGATAVDVEPELQVTLSCDVTFTVLSDNTTSLEQRAQVIDANNVIDAGAIPGPRPLKVLTNSLVRFDWTPVDAGCLNDVDRVLGWQIEVLRLYNEDPQNATDPYVVSAPLDWTRALQVTTNGTDRHYALTLIEGEGVYVWRVRAVLASMDSRAHYPAFGAWSETPLNGSIDGHNCIYGDGTSPQGSVSVFYYRPVDGMRNRAHQRSWAPAIHRPVASSESVTYVDGLGRPMQAQMRDGETSVVRPIIAIEQMYDHEGRPALSTLGAPVEGQQLLAHRARLNAIATTPGQSRNYAAEEFDSETTYGAPLPIQPTVNGVKNPVSAYFSDQNPDLTVADADGYPYSRVLMSADGRPAVISREGQHHHLGAATNAVTVVAYGTPADAELTSVFGSEAPNASDVHKTLLTSEDGVTSVSYTDRSGRQLASCLVHPSTTQEKITTDGEGALLNANGAYENDETHAEKINTIALKHALEGGVEVSPGVWSASKSIVIAAPTTVTLRYQPSVRRGSIWMAPGDETCPSICYTCDWNVVIKATRVSPPPMVEAQEPHERLTSPSNQIASDRTAFVECNIPTEQPETTVSLELPSAGTWVFERIVRFNSQVAPAPPDFSTTRLGVLEATLSNGVRPLQSILDELFGTGNGLLPSPETQLELYEEFLAQHGGKAKFFLEPRDACEKLDLPSIVPCPTYSCDAPEVEPGEGFESFLVRRWLEHRSLPHSTDDVLAFKQNNDINVLFRKDALSPDPPIGNNVLFQLPVDATNLPVGHAIDLTRGWGIFDQMVEIMAAQPQGEPDYACERLWKSWTVAVDIAVRGERPGGEVRDIIGVFLDIAGRRLDNRYAGTTAVAFYDAATGWAFHRWRLIDCDGSVNCNGKLTPPYQNTYPADDLLAIEAYLLSVDPAKLEKYLEIVDLVNEPFTATNWRRFAADQRANCDKTCESRRLDFERQARMELAPVVDEARVHCIVEALVHECKTVCKVPFPDEQVQQTPAILEATALRLTGRADVKLGQGGQCDSGYQWVTSQGQTSRLKALAEYLTRWYNQLQRTIDGPRCYNVARAISDFYQQSLPGYQVPQCVVDAIGNWTYTEGPCTVPVPTYSVTVIPGLEGEFRTESDPQDSCEDCRLVFIGPDRLDLAHPFAMQLNALSDAMWGLQPDQSEIDSAGIASSADSALDAEYLSRTTLLNGERFSSYHGPVYWSQAMQMYATSIGINGAMEQFGPVFVLADTSSPTTIGPNPPPVFLWLEPSALFRASQAVPDTAQFRHYGGYGFLFGQFQQAGIQPLMWMLDATERTDSTLLRLSMAHKTLDNGSYFADHDDLSSNEAFHLYDAKFTDKLGQFGINGQGYLTFLDHLTGARKQINSIRFYHRVHKVLMGSDIDCPVTELCGPMACGACVKYSPMDDGALDPDNYRPIVRLTCEDHELTRLKAEIARRYYNAKGKLLARIRDSYSRTCMDYGTFADKTTIEYQESYYHYTLAYYDRAGRVVKTVPPRGVSFENTRTRLTPPVGHALTTTFTYNSFGQVLTTTTPDEGTSENMYDEYGRLRFTIDAVQAAATTPKASYVKYDKLSRAIETGELHGTGDLTALKQTLASEVDDQSYPDATVTRKDLRRFHYTSSASSNTGSGWSDVTTKYSGIAQRNLRGNLSWAESVPDAAPAQAAINVVRTYYSYDAHGDLEWEVHSIPLTSSGTSARLFARTEYTYDRTLGAITQVDYERGTPDRFLHAYTYDASGALAHVSTSRDSVIWERDATYAYHDHGPLRRVVLGEDAVQGTDYTLTLHGQLKGINVPTRSAAADPGKDGFTAFTDVKDAFGMALSYYAGDYDRTYNGTASALNSTDASIADAPVDLFGGLVGSATYSVQEHIVPASDIVRESELIGESYRYDVLGRLRSSTTLLHANNVFTAEPTGGWSSSFKYDQNGNLIRQKRYGLDNATTPILIDDATIHHQSTSNRVQHASEQSAYADDEGQELPEVVAGRTSYDAKGRVEEMSSGAIGPDHETTYNSMDQPATALRGATTTTFVYDPFGSIVRQDVVGGEATVRFLTIPATATTDRAVYTHQTETGDAQIAEWSILSADRIGVDRTTQVVSEAVTSGDIHYRHVGSTLYELTDQVGSVRAVISDVVDPDPNNPGRFQARVLSRSDYEPYGARRTKRFIDLESAYRYGWQGMRLLDGVDQRVDYVTPFRLYDVRVGRWVQADPIFNPTRSSYQVSGLNPLQRSDPWGLDDLTHEYDQDFVGPRRRPQQGDTRIVEGDYGPHVLYGNSRGQWEYDCVDVHSDQSNDQHWTTNWMAWEFDRIDYSGTLLDLFYAPVNVLSDVANIVPRTGNAILGSIREIDEKGLIATTVDGFTGFASNVSSTGETVYQYFATKSVSQIGSDLFFTIGSGQGVEFALSIALDGGLGNIGKASKVSQLSKVDDLPKYLYHYTDEASAQKILNSQLGREATSINYLTPNGSLTPLQAQIELALPTSNPATVVLRVSTEGMSPAKVILQRRVTGNVYNRAGGGFEVLYEGTIKRTYIERVKP